MSGVPSYERSVYVRAIVGGAACGLCVVFGSWALAGYVIDWVRHRHS